MAPARLSEEGPEILGTPSTKPTVYLLDKFHPEVESFCRDNFNAVFPSDPDHQHWRQKGQYILVRSSYVTGDDISVSPNLRAIGKQGVGIDKIDSAACAKRGIKILNTPGVNAFAVAELVLGLTMGVARGVGRIVGRQSQGISVPKETCDGQTISGKSIGIVGMGHIGKAVAKIFQGAFGSPVIAYDPFLPEGAWAEIPHQRVTNLDELLEHSDIVTLHVPLTSENRGLISLPQLKLMKETSILINASRGGLVDEADLEVAMEQGLIWGAGLDAHEQEPPTKEKYGKLWDLGVLSTPHIGGSTGEIQKLTGMAAAKFLLEHAQKS